MLDQLFLHQLYLSNPAVPVSSPVYTVTGTDCTPLRTHWTPPSPPLPPCYKPTDTTPDSSANGISSRNRKDSDYYSIFYDQGEYRDPTFIESTDPWPGNHQFGERVLGFSTDLVTEKAIRWMKEQDGNQPFLMCCHSKQRTNPTTTRYAWSISTTASPSPNPKTCWTGDRKPTAVLSKDRHWKSWNAAGASHHRTPTSGGVATPDCRSAPKGCNGRRQTCFLPKVYP